jgi:RND family efflux transporter MFP subunit
MDAPLPRAYVRQRRLRSRALLALLLLACAALAVGVARLEARIPTVSRGELWTGRVTRGELALRVQGSGVLRPEAVRWLTAESPGRVEAVLIKPGTVVAPATVLVRLENLDLQLQADEALRDVQGARAQVLALEHQQAQTELDLAQQLGLLENELADASRRATAYREGAGLIVARNESEREQDRASTLTTQVALAQDKLRLLRRLGPRQREVSEAQSAQLERVHAVRQQMLERLFIRAPAEGTVQEVLVEPGQWVLPGAAVAKLRTSERLEAVLRIPADEVAAVAAGQRVSIRTSFSRGQEGALRGSVRRIAPAAQQSTVDVEVALEGALPEGARADQSIDGAIETRRVPDTLSLPRPVGLPLTNTVPLYRIAPETGVATRVDVTVGLVSADTVQVLGGLSEGDEIILSDTTRYGARDALQVE